MLTAQLPSVTAKTKKTSILHGSVIDKIGLFAYNSTNVQYGDSCAVCYPVYMAGSVRYSNRIAVSACRRQNGNVSIKQKTNKKKEVKNLKKIIIGFLAVLGGLFLLLMLLPDDVLEDETPHTETISMKSDDSKDSGSHNAGNHVPESSKGSKSSESSESSDKEIDIETDAKSATVMIYMNGSDLETEAGEASTDISEMLSSGIGKNANVVIQTMGTEEWQNYGISSKTSQRYIVKDGRLKLVEDGLGQLDCGSSKTLSEFIGFGKTKYPADRYIFIFWNHGGGPVYGFGYDDKKKSEDSLTLDEMANAFSKHKDITFDMIGMDCCIMANLETCAVLAPFCRYTVLSEDFESGLGWDYRKWMKTLEENPGISTPLLGKQIIDTMVAANNTEEGGDSSTMVLVDESAVSRLFDAWTKYAYANADKLCKKNYSRQHKAKGRSFPWEDFEDWTNDDSDVTLADYYISDMLAVVENVGVNDDNTKSLKQALKDCVAYFGHTSDKNELTGIAVSLPYGDSEFYDKLFDVYTKCGIDSNYIAWLENFVNAEGNSSYYDYDDFENAWGGWSSYDDGWKEEYNQYWDDSYGDWPESEDDWTYDYNDELWYLYEGENVYLYDDQTNTMYCYDMVEDILYYYDEARDEWYEMED